MQGGAKDRAFGGVLVRPRAPASGPGSDARHEQATWIVQDLSIYFQGCRERFAYWHCLEGSHFRPHCVTQGALVLNAENSIANSD
jgi:hypothetical protein